MIEMLLQAILSEDAGDSPQWVFLVPLGKYLSFSLIQSFSPFQIPWKAWSNESGVWKAGEDADISFSGRRLYSPCPLIWVGSGTDQYS